MKKVEAYNLQIKPFGNYAVLIEWPPIVSESILNDILDLKEILEKQTELGIRECVNAYHSLTVIYDPSVIAQPYLISEIKILNERRDLKINRHKKLWHIPVCYDPEFGIDLEEIQNTKGLTSNEVVSLHCDPTYTIYFIGFLPGFLYLGGLADKLHMPRKATPRMKIASGAVAIGGQQTGIYPCESPGGWNIVGNCPLELFDPQSNPPCFSASGDKLRFHIINKTQHAQIKQAVAKGEYQIQYDQI